VDGIHPYEGTIAAVFSNGGTVVAHFDLSRVGKPMAETEADLVGDRMPDFVSAIKNGDPYTFTATANSGGAKSKLAIIITPFSAGDTGTPWALAMGVPQAIINAPVFKMLRISIIISVVMLLVIAAAAFAIARSISVPIGQMGTVVSGLGEGDLTGQLHIKRRDEIGDMAKAFNETADKIKNLVLTIK
jgi:methyl-accepting chemotaxis protein